MNTINKNSTCPICNKKLGFLKHEFEDGIQICNTCYTNSGVKLLELAQRGQKNITIDELNDRVKNRNEDDYCAVCDTKLNILITYKLADAKICGPCVTKSKVKVSDLKNTKLSEVKFLVNGTFTNISPTKRIGKIVHFNENTKEILILPTEIINYSDVTSFELIEDGDPIASGGIGRAVVGGALFGGAGAIVGSVTGKNRNCTNLQIKLTVKDSNKSAIYITFIDEKVKKNSKKYTSALNHAQECLSTLQIISDQQEEEKTAPDNFNVADEILKFKELLDVGAISEEEYNVKKSELLDI